jgi:hypothetical protein
MAPLGYEASELVSGIWSGVNAILQGDPNTTGEERFWTEFARIFGPRVYEDKAMIDDFYTHEFHNASIVTHRTPLARAAVDLAHQKGAKVVLATNPIFPLCAVHSRLQWAGLTPEDLGLTPSRCLMIGNDVGEDIQSAQSLGLATFLIEDCILGDPTEVTTPSGTFEDCIHFLENLPDKN